MINSIGGLNYSFANNEINRKSKSFQKGFIFPSVTQNKHQKISFSEGVKIVGKGFVTQLKDMCETIVKHPIRTLVSAVTVSGVLVALPIIGIPTVVGGATLAIGFGTLGATKFISNALKAIKNSKNGEYDKARENLRSVGASTLDLALSLPFVPKSLKGIKDFAKYGKVGFDSALFANLKSTKGLSNKFNVLNKANSELIRSQNFQSILDKKLDTIMLSSHDKALLKQKLLKLNVSDDKFLDVVLDEYLKSKGTIARPKIVAKQTTKYGSGLYNSCLGEISVKDYSMPDLPSTPSSVGKKIRKSVLKNNVYECEVVDYKNGNITYETISRQIFDDYKRLSATLDKLAPKSRQVATIIHEGEHMHQHGEVARAFGLQPKQTNSVMRDYVRQKGQLQPTSAGYLKALKYKQAVENYTSAEPIAYLNNELELGARSAQLRAMQTKEFRLMDYIFKQLDATKKTTYIDSISPSIVQTHNSIS